MHRVSLLSPEHREFSEEASPHPHRDEYSITPMYMLHIFPSHFPSWRLDCLAFYRDALSVMSFLFYFWMYRDEEMAEL